MRHGNQCCITTDVPEARPKCRKYSLIHPRYKKSDSTRQASLKLVPFQYILYVTVAMHSMYMYVLTRIYHSQVIKVSCDGNTKPNQQVVKVRRSAHIDHRQVVTLNRNRVTTTEWQVEKLCRHRFSGNITSQFFIGHLGRNPRHYPRQVAKRGCDPVFKTRQEVQNFPFHKMFAYFTSLAIRRCLCTHSCPDHHQVVKLIHDGKIKRNQHVEKTTPFCKPSYDV